jgi:hypothetical protein
VARLQQGREVLGGVGLEEGPAERIVADRRAGIETARWAARPASLT